MQVQVQVQLSLNISSMVEFLGRSNGIGFQIHLYFQLFDVAMVTSYAASFIMVMIAVEYGVMRRLEVIADRWRAP